MRIAGLRALKAKLGKYIRLAAGGETAVVADRDRGTTEAAPPRAPVAKLDTLLEELAADRADR